jgi:hypothetical protein
VSGEPLMANQLVDIVNFNADASCLYSAKWLENISGGASSYFCQWLNLFIENNKKISLGLTGASIADLKLYNPESLDLINQHQNIFEIILRPWSHDIGIYRKEASFLFNVAMGIRTIETEFSNISRYYLPPEFMINGRQICLLEGFGIEAIFINPNRYDTGIRTRLPRRPYEVKATSNVLMKCITIKGTSFSNYLRTCQLYDASHWNDCIRDYPNNVFFSWRDGESSFLVPDGLGREQFWLENEDQDIQRNFLADLEIEYTKNTEITGKYLKSYPVHSFLDWMQEMKMLWFINETSALERRFADLTNFQKSVFLQLINSDILASVEKKSPQIQLVVDGVAQEFVLYRAERGAEGEEYLSIFNQGALEEDVDIQAAGIKKLFARNTYLKRLLNGSGS